jgi:PAS domain S-box-containing protein
MGKTGISGDWREHFRLLVENITDYALFLLDHSGRVVDWNPGAERLLGYSAHDILQQNFAVFYPPEDRKAGKPSAELRRARETGRCESEGWR